MSMVFSVWLHEPSLHIPIKRDVLSQDISSLNCIYPASPVHPGEEATLRVVLFLIGTFITKLASGEAGEEVTCVVIDETEFHEGRIIFFAAWVMYFCTLLWNALKSRLLRR